MRIGRKEEGTASPQVVEVVSPRTNVAAITAAENFFGGLAIGAPFCLEMAATATARWFQFRAGDARARRLLQEHLQVAYPQAELRPLAGPSGTAADPAIMRPGTRVVACTMGLAAGDFLPLRTFRDVELATTPAAQGDPVLGLLAALGTVPPDCRALAQLVLQPATPAWSQDYLRMAVEHPLAAERAAVAVRAASPSSGGGAFGPTAFAAGMLLFMGYGLLNGWLAVDWREVAPYAVAVLALGGGLVAAVRWWKARHTQPMYDVEQVREKVSRPGFRAQLRLAVAGPAEVAGEELQSCLERVVAAYGVFATASGNRLVARPLKLTSDLSVPRFQGSVGKMPILNARELAGLWHLPLAEADVPLLERTGARRILPLPEVVAEGCRIGLAEHQGRSFPVCIPEADLRRHLMIVAKTGRGKSALEARIALHVLGALGAGGKRPALILIDPHGDLAQQVASNLPQQRRQDAIYLDAANLSRPFGLNLLDVGLGWDRDQMTMMVLQIFRREFSQAWGFRMEAAFRYGLRTLFEANQTICGAEPSGRHRQYTILDLPPLLSDPAFRGSVLQLVSDPEVRGWWTNVFQRLPHAFQVEVVFPVQTKIFRFAGIDAARRIVGQPCSTIDPLTWVQSGAAVIVNSASGIIGRDASALIGDLLLNLVTLTIAQQASLEPKDRARSTVIADEIHLMPGADYETLLSEMGKYGSNLVLSTQSLARLDALDRELGRALRSTIFANIDDLVVFNTSGEDALYLEKELGETVNRHDIFALGEHDCYIRLRNGRDGGPLICSVHLDPPPPVDPEVLRSVAEASATTYGRDAAAVDLDLAAAQNRVDLTHEPPGAQGNQGGTGAPKTGHDDEPSAGCASPTVLPSGGGGASAAQVDRSAGAATVGSQTEGQKPRRKQRSKSRPRQKDFLTKAGRIRGLWSPDPEGTRDSGPQVSA